GVMMRSPGSMSIVCRRRSGELDVRERPMPHAAVGWRKLPFLRGVSTVVESLRLGSRALRWSAELFEQDLREDEEGTTTKAPPPPAAPPSLLSALALSVVALVTQQDGGEPAPAPASEKKGGSVMGVVPIVFAIVLFVVLPQAGANGINKLFDLGL